jgi:hypothetical protein
VPAISTDALSPVALHGRPTRTRTAPFSADPEQPHNRIEVREDETTLMPDAVLQIVRVYQQLWDSEISANALRATAARPGLRAAGVSWDIESERRRSLRFY